MATKITKEIRREIEADGTTYTVVFSPKGVRLTQKRGRLGVEMSWARIWNDALANDGLRKVEK